MTPEAIKRRIAYNIRQELRRLPHLPPKIPRPKEKIDKFIARVRVLNAPLWKQL